MSLAMVLMYHVLRPAPADANDIELRMFVHPDRFAEQMEQLHRRGFRSLTLDEHVSGVLRRQHPPKAFLLTFDDAYAHIDQVATRILRRLGFTAAMFVPWHHLGGTNTWDEPAHPNLARLQIASVEDLRGWDRAVWEIASHGMRHDDLRPIPSARRVKDLIEARERLTDLADRPVRDFAYPYGLSDDAVQEDVKRAGYRSGFMATQVDDAGPFRISRRAVNGNDSMESFRLKTSRCAGPLFQLSRVLPRHPRVPVRTPTQ